MVHGLWFCLTTVQVHCSLGIVRAGQRINQTDVLSSVSLSLFLCLSVSLSISLSLYLFLTLSLSLPISLPFSPMFLYCVFRSPPPSTLSLLSSLRLSLSISISPPSPSLSLSLLLSVPLSHPGNKSLPELSPCPILYLD